MIKKHLKNAILAIVVALLSLFYYRISNSMGLTMTSGTAVRVTLFVLGLFVFFEGVEILCRLLIAPSLQGKRYCRAYGIIIAFCFLAATAAVVVYKIMRFGGLGGLNYITLLRMMGIAVGLFVLCIAEIHIVKAILGRGKKGFDFTLRELTAAVLCVLGIGFSLIPTLSDYVKNRFPQSYRVNTFLDNKNLKTESGVVGHITSENRVSQTFICGSKMLRSATFSGATYARENFGTLQIRLVDPDTEEMLEQWDIDMHEMRDNCEFTVFVKDPYACQDMQGKTYRFDFDADKATNENSVTLYYSKVDYYNGGTLLVNGEETEGDLYLALSGLDGPANYEQVRIVLCCMNAIILEALILLAFRRKKEFSERQVTDNHE